MISYVRKNEETSCLKIVHFHNGEEGIPSEMEANVKSQILHNIMLLTLTLPLVLDEQFPEITIDLVWRSLTLSEFLANFDFRFWSMASLCP
jgi:hypothetical protein